MTAPVAMRPAAARALSPVGPTMLDDRGGLVGDGLDGAAARQGGGEAEGALGADAGASSCVDECALHTNGAEGLDPGIGDARGEVEGVFSVR